MRSIGALIRLRLPARLRLLPVVVIGVAMAHGQQVSPGRDIRWPVVCNSPSQVYIPQTNRCADINAIDPTHQIVWPSSCNGAYVPASNSCVPPGTAANPAGNVMEMQINGGGTFAGGTGVKYDSNGGITMPGAMWGASVNHLDNLAAQSGTGSQAQFNNWIAQNPTTRSFLWIDPTAAAGSPTTALSSFKRVIDARGTSCMDNFGTYTGNYNAFCIYALEDKQQSTTGYSGAGNFSLTYDSEKGGVYTYTSPGNGFKSDRTNLGLATISRTMSQTWGINQTMEAYAGAENDPFSVYEELFSGYVAPGQEPSTGFRAQMYSGSAKDGSGGVFKGTISAIAGNTVTFTSTDAHVSTIGEGRIIRDLNGSYSTGSIANATCNGASPNICTITGTGTTWTSIAGFVGTHTTYNMTGGAQGAVLTNNLAFCFVPNGNANSGHDWCVPILQGLTDTTLTVNLNNVSQELNTPWYGPTTGNYAIYHAAWPTAVGINVNAPQTQNYTFTSGDNTGLHTGDTFDQVIAYNQMILGGLILQQRDIGEPYMGGGWLVQNYGDDTTPPMNDGYSVSGRYLNAFQSGAYSSGDPNSAPSNVLSITQRGNGAIINDTTQAQTTTFNLYQFRDSANNYFGAIQIVPNTTDQHYGLCLFQTYTWCVNPTGNITTPGHFLQGLAATGNIGNQNEILAQGFLGSYQSCIGMSYTNGPSNSQFCNTGSGSVGFGASASGAPVATGISFGANGTISAAAVSPNLYQSASNCSNNSGTPVACAAAPAGTILLFAGTTSVVINTTAVTATSEIFLSFDSSLGARMGATCNATFVNAWVSARTAGTSFTITAATAPATNPACFSYFIVN